MPNQFQLAGAQEVKQVRFAPIWTNRFFSGLYTQRNPLRSAGSAYEERWVGMRTDAIIAGSNVEISNRLTPVRRPGLSVYNSQSFTSVDYFYEFRLFSTTAEQIKVMTDTAGALFDGTGLNTQALVYTKTGAEVGAQTFMQYVANVLYFGTGVNQKKWLQTLITWQPNTVFSLNDMTTFVIDSNGNVEQAIAATYANATISAVQVAANILTLTIGSTAAIGIVGASVPVVLYGLGTATFLNGQTITAVIASPTSLTASFTNANYGPAADTGIVAIQSGGTATSGGSTPTWNASSAAPNNITIDNTVVWANRGTPVENWGIVGPTGTPTVNPGASNSGWQANAYYSNNGQCLVDSNGNLQQATTPGTTGTVVPTWSVIPGGTTVDGTVVWTYLQSAASMVWTAHTHYAPGTFLINNASGTNCLFQLLPLSRAYLNGTITATGWNTQFQGSFNKSFPAPAADFTFTSPSLIWIFQAFFNEVYMIQMNGAGEQTAFVDTGHAELWEAAITGTLHIPVAGQYSFTLQHNDGAFMAFGGGAQKVSGTLTDPQNHTVTAVLGFNQIFGTNTDAGSTTIFDHSVWNFPTAGDYQFEIDWCNDRNQGAMQLVCNGLSIVNLTAQASESGAVSPVWPAFSTNFAPKYATVTESLGQYVWQNLGPVADAAWHAQELLPTLTSIIDSNNNFEKSFRTGITGSKEPTWSTALNGLTADNPNLIWINTGTAPAPPIGTITTVNGGWSYAISLVNTVNNTVSNAGPVSSYSGNFTGAFAVTIPPNSGLPTSVDPQVDYVAIFRTKDGGANWYLIEGPGNSIYTMPYWQYAASGFRDTTLDANLDILYQAPLNGQNSPPPTGFISLTYHLNRVFGSVGNTVYWSTGPDTTIGNGVEAFDPTQNFLVFPSLVKRIVPTSIGAIVFTVSDIYLISGQGTNNSPILSQPYAAGVGLLSYNALAVNGTLIYLFTSDSQVISLDPSSGIGQIGFPIGDQFEASNWNPANVYVTWHVSGSQDQALYVSDGTTGWFRMTPTASPETGLTWSPFATIVGGLKAVQSIETAPGVHRLLVGPSGTGNLLRRDITTFADNGTPYLANFTVGSIVLAQPGQIAELAFITTDAPMVGSAPIVGVLIDEVTGPFDFLTYSTADPPQLPKSQTTYNQRFYLSQTKDPAICRHMQMQFIWPAENFQNELYSATLFGSFAQEA